MSNASKAGILLTVFAVYVILQFLWWAYMLLSLNTDYFNLKSELYLAWGVVPEVSPADELARKRFMIFGEGLIFLSLLLTGIVLSARFLRRDFALARMQRNFLLSVSHELKTPIASMQLYLQTLLSRNPEPEKRQDMLSRALSDNQRLQKLVDKLLLATQLENSALEINPEPLELNEAVSRAIATAEVLDAGRHRFAVNTVGQISLNADELALDTIIMNLIENAIKYAPDGSDVVVSTHQQNNEAVLAVSNTGDISPKEQKLIFSKFYRVGNETTRTTKGTGIGLFLVKSLVQLHKGRIELVSKNNTVTFKVSLPA